MSNTSRPKASIQFPNSWAANSFLLKIRQMPNWNYVASSNATNIKVMPSGEREYILIGLIKKAGGDGGPVTVVINAEKLGHGADKFWQTVFDWARPYRFAPIS